MSSERRMRIRAPLAFLVAALAAIGVVATSGARNAGTAVGAPKLCGFVSANDNNTTATETVKVQAAGAAGHKGTLVLQGAGMNHTAHLTFKRGGIALTSFAIQQPGVATVTVKVAARPAQVRTVHLRLNPSSNLIAADCTPR